MSSHTAQASRFSIQRFVYRCCYVDLLVAVEMYELQVGPLIRSALAFGTQVVPVESFSVEEGSFAVATASQLGVR